MSNFTKSVLYSTTVLAAGLIAIFSIYNNVSTSKDEISMANISPAAGESTLGINFGEELNNMPMSLSGIEKTPEDIQNAMEASADALNNMVSAAGQTIPEVAAEIIETAEGAEIIEPDVDTENLEVEAMKATIDIAE